MEWRGRGWSPDQTKNRSSPQTAIRTILLRRQALQRPIINAEFFIEGVPTWRLFGRTETGIPITLEKITLVLSLDSLKFLFSMIAFLAGAPCLFELWEDDDVL